VVSYIALALYPDLTPVNPSKPKNQVKSEAEAEAMKLKENLQTLL